MGINSSATTRTHTPRTLNSITNNTINQTQISVLLRRRAESVIHNTSIDAGSRTLVRYALEINDPRLFELVQRVEDGERIADNMGAADDSESYSPEEKVEALAEIICHSDGPDTRAVALLVLLASLEAADDFKSLAQSAKYYASARCDELNVYGMVDLRIAMLERELFTEHPRLS